jgi:hypothetical protein
MPSCATLMLDDVSRNLQCRSEISSRRYGNRHSTHDEIFDTKALYPSYAPTLVARLR